jgi:hypothetical protein
LNDVDYSWESEATQKRVKTLARSLIASSKSLTKANIERSFLVTGIHPFSMNHFIAHCAGIRNVPDDVMAAANTSVEDERNM